MPLRLLPCLRSLSLTSRVHTQTIPRNPNTSKPPLTTKNPNPNSNHDPPSTISHLLHLLTHQPNSLYSLSPLSPALANSISALPNPSSTALPFFRWATVTAPKPTSALYDALVLLAVRSNHPASLVFLLIERFRHGCFNTSETFQFINQNSPISLQTLIQTIALITKGTARKNAFNALVAALCKAGNIGDARHVIDEMLENSHGADVCTFHPLISIFSRMREKEKVEELFDLMRGRGIKIDVACYNFLLSSLCYEGKLDEAAELLGQMGQEKIKGDSRTYDALVFGACKVGKLDGAIDLINTMRGEGITVLYCTYHHVISGFLRAGSFEDALGFASSIENEGAAIENLELLGRRCVKGKMVAEASMVAREMKSRGFEVGEKLRRYVEEMATVSHAHC
ncbi:hypothetical protein AMTRI_Chr08g208020 [Amborella trichopoda]